MRAPPLEVLLSWPPPDYENPNRFGPAGTIVAAILLAFVTVLLAIRVWTRRYITRSFGLDDILILIAFVPALGFTATGLVAHHRFGWGTDVWDVPPAEFPSSLKSGLASYVFFDLATTFTKLSMLAIVYRLSSGPSRIPRYLVVGLGTFIIAASFSFLLVLLLQCRPLNLYWTVSFRKQNCINEAVHLLVAGIINTSTDFLVVLLPLAIITDLQSRPEKRLSARQALVVNLLFAAGFLASAAGGVRTYITWLMTTHPDHNVTRRAWLSWTASTVELYIGIMAASIPATKPFFARYLPSIIEAPSLLRSRSKQDPEAGGSAAGEPMSGVKGFRGHALTRDSLSTIHEIDEQPCFMRPVAIPDPRRVTFYETDKPLGPRADRGMSVSSSPMRFEPEDQDDQRRPSLARLGSSGSDVSTREHTEGVSFV